MSNSPRAAKISRSKCRKVAACALAIVAFALCLFTASPRAARAQGAGGSQSLVISQVYTRGGEAGAAFQNDFVEIFNRSNSSVDMNNWGLHLTLGSSPAPSTVLIRFVSSRGIVIEPGRYLLIKLSGGANGQPLPFADFDLSVIPVPLNLNSAAGTVGLLLPNSSFQGCPTLQTTGVVDYVGYGGATCFEGVDGPAPAPALTEAILRDGGGCSDVGSSALDFHLAAPQPRNGQSAAAPCDATPAPSFFNFAAPQFDAAESQGRAEILVTRTGDTSEAATVEYLITGGTAFGRSDYTSVWGTLRFAPGETVKSFEILLTDDATQEPNETIEMLLTHPTGGGAVVGLRGAATLVIHDNDFGPAPNPIDESGFYARQHYHDFLNREPDASGLAFWTENVEMCGADAVCREVKRIDTSAAFFLSIEFQRTGFLVYRLYRASLPPVQGRTRSLPRYLEFIRDTQEVGRGVIVREVGWEQKLEDNTVAFLDEFVKRPEFSAAYPAALTPAEYVDKLNAQAGGVLSQSERDALVAELTAGLKTRAGVLRNVAENAEFSRRELNPAFVLMQYFGYLRRAPNDAPDTDFTGYDFWLQKLNEFGGDFKRAEMVKPFITSDEYRARFATPVP